MVVTFHNIYILPIVVFVWFPVTFLVTYIVAVYFKDTVPFMPYISDTGTYSPESCLFGQMLNIGATLMATVLYVRYRQVKEIIETHALSRAIQKLNKVSLWLGVTASLGVSLVGNFQETNAFVVHLIGAGLAFGLGTVYEILETLVSLKIYPRLGTSCINYVRIVLSVICFICSTLTLIFAGLSFFVFDGDDIAKWKPYHAGYKFHVVSAISEWITAICTMAFILTYTNEFRKITMYEPEIELEDVIKQQQSENNRY